MRWKQWKPAASIEQAYVPILIRKCKNVGIMQRLEKKGKKKHKFIILQLFSNPNRRENANNETMSRSSSNQNLAEGNGQWRRVVAVVFNRHSSDFLEAESNISGKPRPLPNWEWDFRMLEEERDWIEPKKR